MRHQFNLRACFCMQLQESYCHLSGPIIDLSGMSSRYV
jgi:hypothetical protein